MKKQDIFGSILELNGIKVPKQKDFNDFTLEPIRNYPFDSRIITSYMITRIKDGEQLQITPEQLWKQLKYFTKEFEHSFN